MISSEGERLSNGSGQEWHQGIPASGDSDDDYVAVSGSPDPMFLPANAQQRFNSPDGSFEYLDARPGKGIIAVALDAGDNAPNLIATDLAGAARIDGTTIDLGAFEGAFVNFALLHPTLDPDADDNHNGRSNYFDYR